MHAIGDQPQGHVAPQGPCRHGARSAAVGIKAINQAANAASRIRRVMGCPVSVVVRGGRVAIVDLVAAALQIAVAHEQVTVESVLQ